MSFFETLRFLGPFAAFLLAGFFVSERPRFLLLAVGEEDDEEDDEEEEEEEEEDNDDSNLKGAGHLAGPWLAPRDSCAAVLASSLSAYPARFRRIVADAGWFFV